MEGDDSSDSSDSSDAAMRVKWGDEGQVGWRCSHGCVFDGLSSGVVILPGTVLGTGVCPGQSQALFG